jgi:hypothetical protein
VLDTVTVFGFLKGVIMLSEQDTDFILAVVRQHGTMPIAEAVEIHENHGGLQPHRAAGDFLEAIKAGYLTGTVTLTPKGQEYLRRDSA